MKSQYEELVKKAYTAFNAREIKQALSTMHAEVEWPKAFEGGYVKGQANISEYWTRQWAEINPTVVPLEIIDRPDGTVAVTVHQKVIDLQGNLLFDGIVKHIYQVTGGLLSRMDIEMKNS